MGFDDGAADGEAHAHAALLGGEEGLEDGVEAGDAGAVVFDGGEDVGAAAGHADGEAVRVDGERNAAGSGAVRVWVGELLHGLDAVGDEIHEYLL